MSPTAKHRGPALEAPLTHARHLPGPATRRRSQLLVAKFVDLRLSDPRLEMIAVLGMNFLADNDLRLVLDGSGGGVAGYLSVP